MLGLVGGVEQRLGAVEMSPVAGSSTIRRELLADLGVAGLVGQQHVVPLGAQPLGEPRGLGGLAGALAALERDEAPGRGVDAGRPGERVPQVGHQRDPLPVVHLTVGPTPTAVISTAAIRKVIAAPL